MSSDRGRLALGIAGTGTFARKAHRPAVSRSSFRPSAVFSRNIAHAKAFAISFAGFQPRPYADYQGFLVSGDVVAVDLVLPTPVMASAVRQALAAGKHVLSEKPVAATSACARELIDWWRGQPFPPVWLVSENWRLEPAFSSARDAIEQGRIGQPQRVRCECLVSRKPGSPYLDGWRKRVDSNAGWLTDIGPHVLAALRCVAGDVHGPASAYLDWVEHEDGHTEAIHTNLDLASGLTAELSLMHATRIDAREGFDVRIEVVGATGRLRVDRTRLVLMDHAGELLNEPNAFNVLSVDMSIELFADAIRQHQCTASMPAQTHPLHPISALADLVAVERIQQML